VDSYEFALVTEFSAIANQFQPAAAASVQLWWRDMTLAARWRGW
jgi:hypothetical protein